MKLIHFPNLWLKFLRVNGRTSLQSHKNRTEYWIGFMKVNPKEKHRLNRGMYFELATGNPREDDITRYEDDYNRGVVVTSGYFNPLHTGHLQLFKEARKLGVKLIVIVNNDKQVKLKGSIPFMNQEERADIVRAIKYVNEVVIAEDTDHTVIKTLIKIKPDFFVKGGDSTRDNVPEQDICNDIGIKVLFGIGGGKIQSSSWLKDTVIRNDTQ